MESHKRILGILFIIWGILKIFGMIFLMGFFSLFFPMIMEEVPADDQWAVEWLIPFIQTIGWAIIIIFAIPNIIAGIGLLNKKSWAPLMALIFGCLGVFNFPVGTALCGYSIWVYIEDNKEKRGAA
jgi:hypothetical protein